MSSFVSLIILHLTSVLVVVCDALVDFYVIVLLVPLPIVLYFYVRSLVF